MLGRISKFIIGLILIPIVIGITIAFFENLTGIGGARSAGSRIFLWGVVSYVVLHLFLHKPRYLYTVGHELMHVFATWMTGGGVKSFNVSKEGGSVGTTKSNFFINLSPYFVPTYTLIISLLYFVIPFFFDIPNLKNVYLFSAGFTLSLHLIFTAEVLKVQQPDILQTGYLFSLVTIYIINLLLVAFLVCILFEGVTFENFFYSTYLKSKSIYTSIFKQLFFL